MQTVQDLADVVEAHDGQGMAGTDGAVVEAETAAEAEGEVDVLQVEDGLGAVPARAVVQPGPSEGKSADRDTHVTGLAKVEECVPESAGT